ncbi:hypothetical protein J1614_001347, partial [Plenodomus biglobosus]
LQLPHLQLQLPGLILALHLSLVISRSLNMKFLALITVVNGLVAAAPVVEKVVARDPLLGLSLGVNLGGGSTPLIAVGAGSATVLAVGGTIPKSSSDVIMKKISTAASTMAKRESIGSTSPTPAPASSRVSATVVTRSTSSGYPTVFPSSFPAPIQGQGLLTVHNLPALPPVLDQTFSGILGAFFALSSGICSLDYKCSISLAGNLPSLLVNGAELGAATTISAWCDKGHCYGAMNPTLTATSPFTITCSYLTGTQACSGTVSGAARAIFTNGEQLELWGWITPSGYCKDGICKASIDMFADPMY